MSAWISGASDATASRWGAMGAVVADTPRVWQARVERLRAEAGKCVLLCSNCHAEVEGGVASLV